MQLTMKMERLPEGSLVSEHAATFLHAGTYSVLVDGWDCFVYENYERNGERGLKYLCKLAGAELTERLGLALIRAANIQDESAKKYAKRDQ